MNEYYYDYLGIDDPSNDYNITKDQCGKKFSSHSLEKKKKKKKQNKTKTTNIQNLLDTSCPNGRCSAGETCSIRENGGYNCIEEFGFFFFFFPSFSEFVTTVFKLMLYVYENRHFKP